MENGDSEINIDHLMARIRQAAAERKAQNGTSLIDASAIMHELLKSNGSSHAPAPAFTPTQVSLSASSLTQPSHQQIRATLTRPPYQQIRATELSLQPDFEPLDNDHYHLNDLLRFHDQQFIRNAYRAILKREPDDDGYAGHLENLRSGRFNKIDILASMRYSLEGKGKGVEVEGLTFPAFIRRLYRIPVAGYLMELAVGVFRLPVLLRSQREFESYTVSQQERLAQHFNLTGERLVNHINLTSEALVNHINVTSEGLAGTVSEANAQWADNLSEVNERLTSDLARVSTQLAQDFSKAFEDFSKTFEELSESHKNVSTLHHQKIGGLFREQQAIVEDQEKLRADIQAYMVAEQERSRQQAQLLETYDERLSQARQQYETLLNKVAERLQQTRAELVMLERRSTLLLEEARRRLPEPFAQEQLQTIAAEGSHVLDVLYASFEDEFRGSRQDIKDRCKVYVPMLKDAGITTGILDLGCGRGEWLEVLKEEGFEARGVELNRAMIESCRERSLEVASSDAIAYLEGLPENSLRAITGFHFIEHMSFETLIKMLDEVVRTLKPGGMVIFETPNPENIMVSSYNFYLDPTHRNPLPGPMTRFLLESRGLSRVEVMMLNSLDHKIVGDDELTMRFNDLFFGPRDYAVIGRKI